MSVEHFDLGTITTTISSGLKHIPVAGGILGSLVDTTANLTKPFQSIPGLSAIFGSPDTGQNEDPDLKQYTDLNIGQTFMHPDFCELGQTFSPSLGAITPLPISTVA